MVKYAPTAVDAQQIVIHNSKAKLQFSPLHLFSSPGTQILERQAPSTQDDRFTGLVNNVSHVSEKPMFRDTDHY